MTEKHLKATMSCGAEIDIFQNAPGEVVQITVVPKQGTKIEDSIILKDNQMRMIVEASVVNAVNTLSGLMLNMPQLQRRIARAALRTGFVIGAAVAFAMPPLLHWFLNWYMR